jgi:hypothetical protein
VVLQLTLQHVLLQANHLPPLRERLAERLIRDAQQQLERVALSQLRLSDLCLPRVEAAVRQPMAPLEQNACCTRTMLRTRARV